MLDCWLLTVQVQLSHGKTTCSTIISKHSIGMREGSDNWDNGFREEPFNVFLSSVYMNVIYGWLFYNLFIWIEYMDVLLIICLYEWNMWICICIVCLYEWNQWMFSLLFLYEWNLCMFTLSFVYINVIFGCFPRLIPIEYVNDFYIVCFLNGIYACLFCRLFI